MHLISTAFLSTSDINHFACHEGWAIFNEVEIQRDDMTARFASDDEAIDYVRRCAEAGSFLHQAALRIHEDNPEPLTSYA